jgi:hypothetical protein
MFKSIGMSEMVDKLKQYFANTSPEQFQKDWDETKALDLVGPTVEEFFNAVPAATPWRRYITGSIKTHPPKYGRYLVNRKGGQFRIEVWNNTGFSKDDSNIEFWSEVMPPYIN